MSSPQVAIIIGSVSDRPLIEEAVTLLKQFDIGYWLRVASAHRSPAFLRQVIQKAEKAGVRVFIAVAGGAAHLAGVIASETLLPVIGVPVETKLSGGLDSLLSMVQMPGGVPVGTMAVGRTGALNAVLYALAILGLQDKRLRKKIGNYRRELEEKVKKANRE